jgi:hypothetical protein
LAGEVGVEERGVGALLAFSEILRDRQGHCGAHHEVAQLLQALTELHRDEGVIFNH